MKTLRDRGRTGFATGSWCAWCDRLLGDPYVSTSCSCQPRSLRLAGRDWLDNWEATVRRRRRPRFAPPPEINDDALEGWTLAVDSWTFSLDL